MDIKLLHRLLADNVVSNPSDESFNIKLQSMDGRASLIDYDELIESYKDKLIAFPPARFRQADLDSTNIEQAATIARYNKYRNEVFTPNNSFVYVKLSTGGFAGYASDHGTLGEKIYPILRLTLKYKEHTFDEFINPAGSEKYISDSTKAFLEHDGTLTKALASELNIQQVNDKLESFLRNVGLPKHDPRINRQVYIVSANSEFNSKFINQHLPVLRLACGYKPIDMNLVITNIEAAGIPVIPLNLYGDDPIKYLDEMTATHNLLLQGLRYV